MIPLDQMDRDEYLETITDPNYVEPRASTTTIRELVVVPKRHLRKRDRLTVERFVKQNRQARRAQQRAQQAGRPAPAPVLRVARHRVWLTQPEGIPTWRVQAIRGGLVVSDVWTASPRAIRRLLHTAGSRGFGVNVYPPSPIDWTIKFEETA